MVFSIVELKVNEDDETGVQAISFVDSPAIETNFQYFAKQKRIIRSTADITLEDLDRKYKWVLNKNTDKEICPACQKWSEETPKTLKTWIKTALPRTKVGEIILGLQTEGENGPYNTFCEDACRCHLELVENFEHHFVKMEMFNEVKREVKGLVLKSNQMIYRNNIDGNGNPGYVYFSRDTVRKLKTKYSYNRNITYQHMEPITGAAIMMDTYLDETNNETKWFVKYKIINEKLWTKIKEGVVKGFSIELRTA